MAVDLENGTAEFWYYLRSRQHSTKKWHGPLVISPHHPEYYDERSPGTSHLKPEKEKIPHLRRRQGQVDKADVEIVVPYFLLETAGKVPRKVCAATETSICGGNTRRAPMSRPSRSLSPQKERSSCRSSLLPHCGGPEGAIEAGSLRYWVSIMVAFDSMSKLSSHFLRSESFDRRTLECPMLDAQ